MSTNSSSKIPAYCFYFAGIGVLAHKFGIRLDHLSVGDENGVDAEVSLEPLESWCESIEGVNPFVAARIEDYVSTLLAGSAASFVGTYDERTHIKNSFGSAGLEMRFLRQVWQCLQPEPDRAAAIIVGHLGQYDDGDAEATLRRLWHRAVRILHLHDLHERWKQPARFLETQRTVTGGEIQDLLGRR